MAKRRRLAAPDAAELEELEAGFAAKPKTNPFETKSVTPPIAQVAAESAQLSSMTAVTDRVELAKDQGDAAKWRDAEQAGLVARKIPIASINADFIRRDRMVDDEEAMLELEDSLRAHGLRTPIEVTEVEDGYGLISGYRRLMAFRRLFATDTTFAEIPAFVRSAGAGETAYVSMVEENELRANLSHYERGRIAVLATGQGVFPSVESAVNILFASASKAKRSKVRSFAAVHEALGDLLQHPVSLTEKAGLKLAAALRDGGQTRLREALDGAEIADAKAEWNLLEAALDNAPKAEKTAARGGRPQEVTRLEPRRLEGGGNLIAELAPGSVRVRLEGRDMSVGQLERLIELLVREID